MDFISGTYFKSKCGYAIGDYTSPRECNISLIKKDGDDKYLFTKIELIDYFITKTGGVFDIRDRNLVLHNSDASIDSNIIRWVRDRIYCNNIYTQNLIEDIPKVYPIPIGIANPKWSHGNVETFKRVILNQEKKERMVYANFNTQTNPAERNNCLKLLRYSNIYPSLSPYPIAPSIDEHDSFVKQTHEKYLEEIASSYFTISPFGNGYDCHKTWEAIYLRSIPVVKHTYFYEKFRLLGIPIMIIDEWDKLKGKFSEQLYHDIWKDFDPCTLSWELFINAED